MGIGYNPTIVKDGLVLYFDAANASKSAKGFKNLLDLSTWTLGTGGVTGFNRNGTVEENQRILDTGPFGVSTVVWDTPSNDATSDGDGGWDSTAISIDVTKTYRFSTWMRRKTIGDGYSYLGPHSNWGAVAGQYILNRSNSAENQNPYFFSGVWWGNANDWYLMVGHVWAAGSGSGSIHPDSGIYNTSGTKVANISADYMWAPTNTYTFHRSYLYYSTVTTTNQQWYQPRIDVCDGTEPTIAELISGVGSRWYDLVGSNHGNILNSAALYNSNGYMNFDGVDDHLTISQPNITVNPNIWSIEFVLYPIGTDFIMISPNSAGIDHFVRYDGVNQRINFQVTEAGDVNNRARFSTINSVLLNTYTHVVLTINNLSMKIYVNGNLDSSYEETIPIAGWGDLWHIGQRTNGTYRMSGRLPLLKVYNKVLSAVEVKQNFNATRRRFSI